jgi:hypothetical protein
MLQLWALLGEQGVEAENVVEAKPKRRSMKEAVVEEAEVLVPTKKKSKTTQSIGEEEYSPPTRRNSRKAASDDEKSKKPAKVTTTTEGVAFEQERLDSIKMMLFIDIFDLFVPGHNAGFIRTGSKVVGTATTISTLLSLKCLWDRI